MFPTGVASKVFAIVSSFAEALIADTQLVESVNSIIRLISTRCHRIDLPAMSARVIDALNSTTAVLLLV